MAELGAPAGGGTRRRRGTAARPPGRERPPSPRRHERLELVDRPAPGALAMLTTTLPSRLTLRSTCAVRRRAVPRSARARPSRRRPPPRCRPRSCRARSRATGPGCSSTVSIARYFEREPSDDLVADRTQTGAEGRTCRTRSAQDADAHGAEALTNTTSSPIEATMRWLTSPGMGLLDGKTHRDHRRPDRTPRSPSAWPSWHRRKEPRSCSPGPGRGLSLTERTARKLADAPAAVLELDVTEPRPRVDGRADGGRAVGTGSTASCTPSRSRPPSCLGGDLHRRQLGRRRRGAAGVRVLAARRSSTRFVPLMTDGGSIVGLDFDATVAWPAYDWMGVAKAALESTSRYLARELGPQAHPGEPGGRRPGAHDGGQVDPRLLAVRGRVGRPRSARLGRATTRPRSPRRASRCCRTGSR